jgi:hypothetical protein
MREVTMMVEANSDHPGCTCDACEEGRTLRARLAEYQQKYDAERTRATSNAERYADAIEALAEAEAALAGARREGWVRALEWAMVHGPLTHDDHDRLRADCPYPATDDAPAACTCNQFAHDGVHAYNCALMVDERRRAAEAFARDAPPTADEALTVEGAKSVQRMEKLWAKRKAGE